MSSIPALAVAYARAQIGKPYVWGAEGPNSYDCSGLVWRSYYNAGYHWTRTIADVQITRGTPVSESQLQAGDLVQPILGHIQMYTSNGRIVEAPHTGANVREVPMWGFRRACRLVTSSTPVPSSHPYPGHYIQEGSTGASVVLVQHVVGASADGIFGPLTKAAVERWQRAHRLQVDGVVGPATWKAMFG